MEMDPKVIFTTLLVIGVLGIVGLLIHTKIYDVSMDAVDYVTTTADNETLTALDTGAVALTYSNEIVCIEARNATGDEIIEAVTNYSCNYLGFSLVEGSYYNDTSVNVSYTHGVDTDYHTSFRSIDTTILDSYDLAVVALVVLAAVFLLLIVGLMGA